MKNMLKESNKEVIDKLMSNPSVVTALKRIVQVSKNLSPTDQEVLSKKLAKMPLTKAASHQSAKTSARQGDYFEEKKDAPPSPEKEVKKEPEAPLSSHENSIKGNQFWKKYMIKLASSTDSAEKAKSIYKLISAVPKQDQKFKQTLRKLLDR